MSERSPEPSEPRTPDGLAGLPRDVQPARDLWSGIERRLAPRTGVSDSARRGAIRVRTFLAAAALLAIGVAAGFMLRSVSGDPPPASSLQTGAVPAAAIEQPAAAALGTYRSATAVLRADLDQRLAPVDAETRALVVREMNRIDAAIREIEHALAATPEDSVLEGLLLARYRQQVDLLNRWIPVVG